MSRSSDSKDKRILILGGGLTGLSAAIELSCAPVNWLLLEKEETAGGLARSDELNGYTFDKTGHWLHLQNEDIRNDIMKWTSGEMMEVKRKSCSFSRGVLTGYPFQVHLHGHEPALILECLKGLWEIKLGTRKKPAHFREFIYQNFGRGIAENFLIPYNEKLWGVNTEDITSEWCKGFVPVPPVENVIAGAVGADLPEMGYNVKFLYPEKGGIGELPKALLRMLPQESVLTSCPVEKVDHRKKRAYAGGEWLDYSTMISTAPLPDLADMLVAPPQSVMRNSRMLRASPVVYLDVAVKPRVKMDYHWVYLPDREYPFYRVGVYSNAAPHMAPANGSSLYVEMADRDVSGGKNAVVQKALPALCSMGLLDSAEDILFTRLNVIPHGYVIYDHNRRRALTSLLRFFRGQGIYSCGRYGSWIYSSMEDSILEGRRTAADALKDYDHAKRPVGCKTKQRKR